MSRLWGGQHSASMRQGGANRAPSPKERAGETKQDASPLGCCMANSGELAEKLRQEPSASNSSLARLREALFSLSVSLLLFSCLYIFNFHWGLSGLLYLFLFLFSILPIFSFILSFIHFLRLPPLQWLAVSTIRFCSFTSLLLCLICFSQLFLHLSTHSVSMFPGCLPPAGPVLAAGSPKSSQSSESDTRKQTRTE